MRNPIGQALMPVLACLLLAAVPAMAQNVTSSAITGVVTNVNGAPVADAEVTIVHQPSGTTKVAQTGDDGRYNAKGLRVGGPYTVTVSQNGQTVGERENVYLQLGQTSAINLLAVGGEANAQQLGAITVTANAVSRIFSPENKGMGTNVSQRMLQAMPTPGRSIQDVARLDPRVVVSNRNEGKISAVGQNFRYNNITVDSVGVNDPFGLNPNGLPTTGTAISQDTIAEYQISTANYDVATRRGLGANVNAVTKSGTNEFHGSVYYVYQNDDMVGDNSYGEEFSGFDKNTTAGVTLGGPIVKDRLFFFLSYEESKQKGASAVWGPEGSDSSQTVDGVTSADVERVRDIANGLGMSDLGSLTGTDSQLSDKRYLAKLDWNISNNHRLSLSWQRTKENEPRITGSNTSVDLSSAWIVTNTDNESYALHLYDDWSSNFSTTTTVSYSHYNRTGGPYNGVGMPAVTVHVGAYNGPQINLGTNYSYQANNIDTKTWFASWAGTYYVGDHQIKFGFDYQKDDKYNLFLQDYFGAYTFDTIDDFANADFSTYYYNRPADGLNLGDVAAAFTLKEWGIFLQDTWQASNQLSLQYGVRLDKPKMTSAPLYNAQFAQAGFTDVGGTTLTTNQYVVDDTLVQPRFSFNYEFDTERRMQLRGGLGLFMTNPPAVWIGNIYSNTGVNEVSFTCQTFRGCDAPPFSADPNNQHDVSGAGGGGQMTVNTLDPDFHLPTSWKFTLGFDMELPWNLIGSIDYQMINVKDAIWYQDMNLGEPTGILPDGRVSYYSDLTLNPNDRDNSPYSRENANEDFTDGTINLASTNKGRADNITLQVKRPFHNNWTASVGVTYGKAIGVNAGDSSVAYSSWKHTAIYNANENVSGTSNFETRLRALATVAWRHAFFGNYYTKVSAFYSGRTGHPYSWLFGDDANGDGYYGNDLVYIPNPGDVQFTEGTSDQKIDQFYAYIADSSYLSSHQGQVAGRNGDRAPWYNQLDLSFSQQIPGIFEGNKGIIRFDIYNFLNLLDKDWGLEYRANFPGSRLLADYAGVDPDSGKYIYDISGSNYTDKDGNYRARPIPLNTYPNDLKQRWAVQLTVKYEF